MGESTRSRREACWLSVDSNPGEKPKNTRGKRSLDKKGGHPLATVVEKHSAIQAGLGWGWAGAGLVILGLVNWSRQIVCDEKINNSTSLCERTCP